MVLGCHFLCTWIISRDPQVDVEWIGGGRFQIANHLPYLRWRQMMRSERAESAPIGYRRRELHGRQPAAERPLNDRMLDAKPGGERIHP